MRKAERDRLALEAAQYVRGPNEWKRAICPFCVDRLGSADHRGNFCLNVPTGFWHCFRCGIKGRLPGYEDEEMWTDENGEETTKPVLHEAPEGFRDIFDPVVADELRPARRYMKKRGIKTSTAREAGIGACFSGPLAGRVVVPIFDRDGRTWRGWSARLYRKPRTWMFDGREVSEPKYRYAPGFDRKHTLYNPAALYAESDEPVLCVEGVFDTFQYWPHVVAHLGKPSEGQLAQLLASKRKLVVCLDGDAWTEGEAWALRLKFEGHPRVGFVRLPPKLDPATVDAEWLKDEARKSEI